MAMTVIIAALFLVNKSKFINYYENIMENSNNLINEISYLKIIKEENKVLKTTLTFQKIINNKLNTLESDNRVLNEFLEFQDKTAKQDTMLSQYSYRIAEVIPNDLRDDSLRNDPDLITINLGEQDGIKKNMSVITSAGVLVGLTQETSPFHTTVTKLSNEKDFPKGIAVTIKNQEQSFGVIESFENDFIKAVRIPVNDPIMVGQEVMTSGLGKQFPKGLIIGKVVAINDGDFGITKVASIKYDFAGLNKTQYLFVVDAPQTDM
jgi:rod shape-determining protein MreC